MRRGTLAGILALGAACAPALAMAQEKTRPTIQFNRWQEDWSVLADPSVPREPLDSLKYIPFLPADPKSYLSFGATLRERFESNSAAGFGIGSNHHDNYVLSRSEFHADLRLGPLQLFGQLQSDYAPGKSPLGPVDKNRLDLEQGFAALVEPLGEGTLKLRLGRQQMGFDLQRFVSVRDGPNVRQSFDAAWADYEIGPWRFIGFYSWPVQVRDAHAFDDFGSRDQTYSVLRVERQFSEAISLAGYYSHFTQNDARYGGITADERREIFDVHFSGTAGGFDWDAEVMGQVGRFGGRDVRAWALGSLAGYTFRELGWSPRLGLQFDTASGDRNPNDGILGTFNPLFPNGYYFTLAGYTGYANLIHIKPSLTVRPTSTVKLMLAAAGEWRQTTADAIYTQPRSPVPGTAGQSGRYIGSYGQLRLDWTVASNMTLAVEAVHFIVGDALRRAGGHNSDYVGLQLQLGW